MKKAKRFASLSARDFLKVAEGLEIFAFHANVHVESDQASPVPALYSEFKSVFEKANADQLPPHRDYDLDIPLVPGKQPPFGPIYSLSLAETHALREYLDDNLQKGFIRHSKSPAGAPILFVKKKDGSLRLCVDYRGLNSITVKNRYALPLIPDLLERLRDAKIFTKLDLRGAYNLVRVKEGEEWKTAFRTKFGHFEYSVMPFGLTNAPATFQHFMNDLFRDILDIYVVVYLDDILVFSKNESDHVAHVQEVLRRLQDNNLSVKAEKCAFHVPTVDFLGYVISHEGIKMDPSKTLAINEWPRPACVKDVQAFLGLANFYRRFVPMFSRLAHPLTSLLKKKVDFLWVKPQEEAFLALKSALTSDPVLAQPDLLKPFVVETDASDFAIGAVLRQRSDSGALHVISYYSRKLNSAECNYEVHDKELLAIRVAFGEWRHLLIDSPHKITVFTDHRNLVQFSESRKLNGRQVRWSIFFADFDFKIVYRPGSDNGLPDALSRRPDHGPVEEEVIRPLLSPEQLTCFAAILPDTSLVTDIASAYDSDSLACKIKSDLKKHDNFVLKDGLLYRHGLLYVPDCPSRLEIMKARHDSKLSGHFGVRKTLELVSRDYWWPKCKDYVRDYVRSCDVCSRAKKPRHAPHGLLQPLPVPESRWSSVSTDFIVQLPKSKGYDAVAVYVDRLTKMAHFVPCKTTATAADCATMFVRDVIRLHGIPKEIISDRGPQFTSHFWKRFQELLGVDLHLSTAYHPESDGQTERVNQVLEQLLRCFVNYQQDDWVDLLPLAEFAYNNSLHSATKMTPFFANYGCHPRFDPAVPEGSTVPAADDLVAHMHSIETLCKDELELARARMKKYADANRTDAPDFEVGDLVWLSRRFVKTSRPSLKLDYTKLGPFKIIEKVNAVAFKLELPNDWKIHPVFHVSLLEPHHESGIPGRHVDPPPPVIVDPGCEEWEVQEVLDSRRRRNKLQYLVSWVGYGPEENSWISRDALKNAPVLLREFHARYPKKPGTAPRLPVEREMVLRLNYLSLVF